VPDEYCWAITQAVGGPATANQISGCCSLDEAAPPCIYVMCDLSLQTFRNVALSVQYCKLQTFCNGNRVKVHPVFVQVASALDP